MNINLDSVKHPRDYAEWVNNQNCTTIIELIDKAIKEKDKTNLYNTHIVVQSFLDNTNVDNIINYVYKQYNECKKEYLENTDNKDKLYEHDFLKRYEEVIENSKDISKEDINIAYAYTQYFTRSKDNEICSIHYLEYYKKLILESK